MNTIRDITKALDRITTHRRHNDIFDDWLAVTHATLRMLPAHARSVALSGELATDDEEATELWTRLRERAGYDAQDFKHFALAYGALLAGSDDGGKPDYKDALGEIYMSWAHPNAHTGQFFTPWCLCQMAAQMIVGDPLIELSSRIVEAIGIDWSTLGMDPTMPATLEHIATRYLPDHIERYRPITVQDPAVGSGGMLLAVAETYPQWAVRMGLVQFFGQDIDYTCVLMCRINCMLYGLNGYSLQLSAAIAPALVAPTPVEAVVLHVEAGETDLFGDALRKVA